jgi:hypothetical protein
MSTTEQLIEQIEKRIEFLKTDKTVWTMAWEGSTYNHGPYLRRLEVKRLKAKLKRLQKKLVKKG